MNGNTPKSVGRSFVGLLLFLPRAYACLVCLLRCCCHLDRSLESVDPVYLPTSPELCLSGGQPAADQRPHPCSGVSESAALFQARARHSSLKTLLAHPRQPLRPVVSSRSCPCSPAVLYGPWSEGTCHVAGVPGPECGAAVSCQQAQEWTSRLGCDHNQSQRGTCLEASVTGPDFVSLASRTINRYCYSVFTVEKKKETITESAGRQQKKKIGKLSYRCTRRAGLPGRSEF